jgi:NADH dehydrogenase
LTYHYPVVSKLVDSNIPKIVVVGGGAGGLELVTRLGDTLGRKGRAEVTLIERGRTHFWKPHLHELAAGTVDLDVHELDYLAQSHWHGFRYRFGEMVGLDRAARQVLVGPVNDENGEQIVPARRIDYDILVLAVGSRINDFGTPGVTEHAIALESTQEADRFHRRLINAFLRAHAQTEPLRPEQLNVAIVGAGATGVELSAELHNATRELVSFSLDNIDPDKHIRLHLIEASSRILPALPERISAAAAKLLHELEVEVHVNARVAEVLPQAVKLADGTVIAAEMVVWAAGVKAPGFLSELGLQVNSVNQLVVDATLCSPDDPRIFALGDCAAAAWHGHPGRNVPPRAQAAHQQASYLAKAIRRRLAGKPLRPWRYRDFGSLVSLGEYTTVGNLMGNFVGGNLWLEGLFARWMYMSLYKLHELALHGFWKTALTTLGRMIAAQTEPRVKLH